MPDYIASLYDDAGDPDLISLQTARTWLREHVDDGVGCPCCGQFAKVYRRKIHATMAVQLIRAYRADLDRDWLHMPSISGYRVNDFPKLRYWQLVEEERVLRADGGRAGFWRVTDEGVAFLLVHTAIPKYALVYDGDCLELTGEPVTIRDCLGTRFDYGDLMHGI